MKTIFEIRTVQTKDILRRTAARIMRMKLIIHAVVLIAIAIGFAAFVLSKQIASAYFFSAAFGLSCVGLAIYRFDSVPRKYAERTYSEMVMIHREPVISQISVNSDAICVENCHMHTVHRYSWAEIKGILEDSGLFLLKTEKGSYIIIDKTGFQCGDADSFRSFVLKSQKDCQGMN